MRGWPRTYKNGCTWSLDCWFYGQCNLNVLERRYIIEIWTSGWLLILIGLTQLVYWKRGGYLRVQKRARDERPWSRLLSSEGRHSVSRYQTVSWSIQLNIGAMCVTVACNNWRSTQGPGTPNGHGAVFSFRLGAVVWRTKQSWMEMYLGMVRGWKTMWQVSQVSWVAATGWCTFM